MSKNFIALLLSQFASAFADNAALFALIAYIKESGIYKQESATPILQMSFVVAFVILAPLVGKLADSMSKGKILLLGNIIKAIGSTLILLNVNIYVCYSIIGIGAAIYSPAKYGILPEITEHNMLVKSNGLLEGSTIIAILFGSYVGGVLGDINSTYALIAIVIMYISAAAISYRLVSIPAKNNEIKLFSIDTVLSFGKDLCSLVLKDKTRTSLFGTAIFWGVGGVLRMAMITWVATVLMSDKLETSSLLSGCVAIGVVIGAYLSPLLINFNKMHRVFIPGMLIGVMLSIMTFSTTFNSMAVILIGLGIFGGLYVVPLNALLQSEGKSSTGSGQAIAIQNFIENIVSLSFIGIYTYAIKSNIEINTILYILSAITLFCISLLIYPNWKKLNEIK